MMPLNREERAEFNNLFRQASLDAEKRGLTLARPDMAGYDEREALEMLREGRYGQAD